jgi:copper chaperone CopZ
MCGQDKDRHEQGHDEGHHAHGHTRVKGMTCEHGAAAVTKAPQSLPAVAGVQVDLASGQVSYRSARPVLPGEVARLTMAQAMRQQRHSRSPGAPGLRA